MSDKEMESRFGGMAAALLEVPRVSDWTPPPTATGWEVTPPSGEEVE